MTDREGVRYVDAKEIEILPPEGVVQTESDQVVRRTLSRRDFLIGGAALSVVAVGATAFGAGFLTAERDSTEAEDVMPTSAYDSSDREHYPDQLTGVIGQGMAEKWQKLAVFPGMFVATPAARFFKDAFLTEEVDLGMQGDDRAFIVRPVLPDQNLIVGTGVEYEGNDLLAVQAGGVDPSTFSFFVPGFDTPVYGNYAQSVESLDPLTRIRGGELAYTGSSLPFQHIDVHERRIDSGVVMPIAEKGSHTEKVWEYVRDDEEQPVRSYEVGTQQVTEHYAMAQARIYDDPRSINALIDRFFGNQEVIAVSPTKGELKRYSGE